ncbi:hypothetical protein BN1047_01119 [Mycolicibacterium neoaurum]|uniref:Uncharacterized protein n=1 Tax=Mycolicibacterium neoaurum TaxID=1795 RepID=A0AAV2WGA8_MYCNE|nr:hypothetical protein BN1047_01119 [Mycolicibacterium neoaurum]
MRGDGHRKMRKALQRRGPDHRIAHLEVAATDQAAWREVLVDQQGVVQLADATRRAQLGVTEKAVLAQLGGFTLERKALPADALTRVHPDPQRDGVDEQAHHGLDAGQFVGSPGHRHPEHHVVAVGERRKNGGPGHLEQRADGDATGAGGLEQALGGLLVEFGLGALGQPTGDVPGQRRCQHRGSVEVGQVGLPALPAGRRVSGGQPANVVAVGPGRRQHGGVTAGAVERHELTDEHRQRPAVDHYVVGDHHESPLRVRQFGEHEPDRRSVRQIERSGTGLQFHRGGLAGIGGQHMLPRQVEDRGDHRDRSAEGALEEADPDVGMALQHRLGT